MHAERPEGELLRRLNAVHLRHHAIPADAEDVEAVETKTGHIVFNVHARFVLDEVGQVLEQAPLDGLAESRIPGSSRMIPAYPGLKLGSGGRPYLTESQSRGVLKMTHLRQRRTYRRSKGAAAHPGGHIVDAVSIRERPATVEDRAVPGHWEGDLLVGSRNSYVATLVERRSRYVCLVRVTGKETQTVVRALTRHVHRLPTGLMTTLTWDRGLELAAHRTFSIATGVQVFFCDPKSPWQRGTNENTNGLLRQYLPRRTDLSGYTQAQLDAIALRLNTRPRKTLGYRTPAVTLAETVASTG